MDDLAHKTVARIFGGQDPGVSLTSEMQQVANYMNRKRTGQWADLYGRHSLDEMGQYMDAMEKLSQKIGGG